MLYTSDFGEYVSFSFPSVYRITHLFTVVLDGMLYLAAKYEKPGSVAKF